MPSIRNMATPPDNRAVSALFRVFGGAGEAVVADAEELAKCRGMHRGEVSVLSILIPLTLTVAIGDGLSRSWGNIAGWALAGPVAFLALNILPFLMAAKSQVAQWLLWLGTLLLWAIFRCHAGGIAAVFSYIWIGVAIMNVAAACVLGWQGSMRWPGKIGIAWRMFLIVFLHALAVAAGFKWDWPWGLFGAACVAAALCKAVLDPASQWLGPVYRTTDFKKVLITIDDGPDPHDTPVLLDLLDRHQTKAIFFMIGEKVRAHPELAREVIRRGHEIGNHSLTHPAGSFWCAGPRRTRHEIEGCQRVIEEVTGIRPRWFRAPVGHRNLFTHPVASALGLRIMGWNRRGFDAVEKDAGKVLARILLDLSAGDIVLLHEATPIAKEVLEGVLAVKS